MDKMTPREALTKLINILENSSAYVNEDGFPMGTLRKTYDTDEAEKVLEALVIATEQAPTLEKLGYVRLETKNEKILRKYKRREYTITFSNGIDGDGEIIVSKQDIDGYWYSFTKSELLACAEVIKEIEEEKMKEKEETIKKALGGE